jgi:hypothetical protein
MRRATVRAGLVLLYGTALSTSASAVVRLLNLETPGAALSGGATYAASGAGGPISLGATGAPAVSFGATIPDDFLSGSLTLTILVESSDTGCDVALRARSLYRARSGQARDLGAVDAGFQALDASTQFSAPAAKKTLIFRAAAAGQSVRARFRISPNDNEFPAFKPGDAVAFTVERRGDSPADTCPGALRWNAASLAYEATAAKPAKGRLSLDPFAALDPSHVATISFAGNQAPLRIPDSSPPRASLQWSFVVPHDQKAGTPLDVDILWESAQPACRILPLANGLFRTAVGELEDHQTGPFQSASDGLLFQSASTPTAGAAIDAPTGNKTGRLTYRITASPGTFETLKPGVGVMFGVYRAPEHFADTCGEIGVSGVSVRYTRSNAAPATRRLTLNALALDAATNVVVAPSGFDGATRIDKGGVFGTGFVVPQDYTANTPILLQILADSVDPGCVFAIAPHALYRSRVGAGPDVGAAADGLTAHGASTPFTISGDGALRAETQGADRTFQLRFQVAPTPGFPGLAPGDGISLTLRRNNDATDTCPRTLGIAGWSIAYQ